MCTRCRNVFDDGADLLKGCPACGWKKFMFTRSKAEIKDKAKGNAGDEAGIKAGKAEARKTPGVTTRGLSRVEAKPGAEKKAPLDAPEKDDPKVESIKITAPGTYELNLPSLFEREELIMAVKEGTYLIDLSSAFRKKKE